MLITHSLLIFLFLALPLIAWENSLSEIKKNFENPPTDCKPHTRWWWMGNTGRPEDITFQLEEMHDKGIGGVEQITMAEVYEKGNVPYMSDEFLEMLKFTVKTAKRLGMEVSINFGGPGWIIGGEWVPQADRSKNMVPTAIDLVGPQRYAGPLPTALRKTKRSWEHYTTNLDGTETLLAVVAGKVVDGKIDARSIRILTSTVTPENRLEWEVPTGHWRLMAFWLKFVGDGNAVDHFNKAAMQRYCEYLGGKFFKAFGEEFGKTVDSFFCDSFELANSASGVYWSTGLFDEFQKFKGYDLIRYLPAIWWEIDDISPKIRYDVNHFLHHQGLEAFFKTFLGWCEAHGVKGRIQAYGFTTDNLEASGVTHIPEMEITAGEKDAVPWFDTRIGPKKYVASGAHLYGRNVISVEAYTFMHWELYRSTLEELKIASDNYLRAGATKFYNHGYNYSPEKDIAVSRSIGFAARISHPNIWWKYYPLLSTYIARCSYLLRQGHFAPDVAIYSPLANQWTLDVLNPRKWTREFYWGDLGKLLIANGYDFDLINDDILQHTARFEDGQIKVREMRYKILIIPNIQALPLESLLKIQQYVKSGGIAVALERAPEASTGFENYAAKDRQVRKIVGEMFRTPRGRTGTGEHTYGQGRTYQLELVINRQSVLDWQSSALDPFVKTLRKHCPPDFSIDFAHEGLRENNGLTFLHRKMPERDIYFVTNIQDRACDPPVTFRVKNRVPKQWNPYDGSEQPVLHFRETAQGIEIPVRLAPYASTFFVFEKGEQPVKVEKTNLSNIQSISPEKITGLAPENGIYRVELSENGKQSLLDLAVTDVPSDFEITGTWQVIFEAAWFPRLEKQIDFLDSWTRDPDTRHFSGTARYEINFDLPSAYLAPGVVLTLDPGRVANVAEVVLNGQKIGTTWMRGQTLEITGAARAGANHLVVRVTNTLINRVSGLKEPPPVPRELIPYFGSGTTSYSAAHKGPIGFEPLPASGLLGPVKILTAKQVQLRRAK